MVIGTCKPKNYQQNYTSISNYNVNKPGPTGGVTCPPQGSGIRLVSTLNPLASAGPLI